MIYSVEQQTLVVARTKAAIWFANYIVQHLFIDKNQKEKMKNTFATDLLTCDLSSWMVRDDLYSESKTN